MRPAHLAGLLLAVALAGARDAGAAAPRLLSLGGATTEVVYALGAGQELVGVDLTSFFPDAAKKLPQVGYLRTLPAEGILSLKPDLVLAAPEAGPPAAIDQTAAAGLHVLHLPAGYSAAAALARIDAIGAALGLPERAAALHAAVAADLQSVQAALAKAATRPKVLFLLQAGRGAPLVAGRGTAADAMIALAKGQNVMSGAFEGYRPLSPEAAIAAAPDVLLMTDETVAELGGRDAVLALPELAATPAGKARRLVSLEALYLLGFGPRTAQALRDLGAALHPELALPALPPRPWTAAR